MRPQLHLSMPKPLTEETLTGAVIHQWTIQEYEQHARGATWHVVMISAALILVLYGLFTDNFLFSLIIILAAIILFLQSHQEAPQVPFAITELGVAIGGKFYQYTELAGFYLIYNPPEVKTLYIDTKSAVRPMLRIPLLDQNPIEVRDSLRQFLTEDVEKEEEPRGDLLARRWKIH